MIIDIFLPLSLVFIMFTLGLGLTLDDFSNVAREPKAFGVGIFNQMICLPIVAFGVVLLSGLSKEMAYKVLKLASYKLPIKTKILEKA